MSEILGLEHVALSGTGPTLSLSIGSGQSIAVVGPTQAGKSRLLRILAEEEKPGQGQLHFRGKVSAALGDSLPSRRAKVQSLAKGFDTQAATEWLICLGLYDQRGETFGDLTPAQSLAAELVTPLLESSDLVLMDGQLDGLDPWVLSRLEERIRAEKAQGRSFVFATHRTDLAARADGVIVLRDGQVRFAGSVEDLLRTGPPHTLQVETRESGGVRALVEPFEVSVRTEGDGLRMEAKEGQALAARLLLEGYGDIRFVIVRPTTFEEALLRL